MNARTAARLLILSTIAATASCSWMPFGSSHRAESTQPVADAPADAAPVSQSNSSGPRGAWPTTPVPPVTGNEIDTGRKKTTCTTAQRLRNDC